ncbi:glycosyl transferase [Affinibrenneria salicis]|uniref:Glycosyl transferase n=1 Tax=Affinibrenneria salicis TaxID=2590031 RepID=A0A5J5FZV3_9GAMM|nr:glycosyl transferase [Affinibrenneria salicis]KAA8999852.1 glycosyl transferase [Affinibrenneria salicis]
MVVNESNAILVVLYNKLPGESTTLNMLLEHEFPNSSILIHNNGPKEIRFENDHRLYLLKEIFNKVESVNCLENKPLSSIYNEFIQSNKHVNQYVILDDDTEMTNSFFLAMNSHDDIDVELPKIKSSFDGEIYYPVSSGRIISGDGNLDSTSTISIGSGLIIKKKLVDKFCKYNMTLFDENFALYGVDFSFFRRIYKLNSMGENIEMRSTSVLKHSLSRLEGASSKNAFRHIERILDVAITARQYPSIKSYYILLRCLINEIYGFNLKNTLVILKAFLNGKHPRC